jgi:hypothetical protein
MTKQTSKTRSSAGRPKGTTKPDSLVFIKVVLGVTKETEEWYKSLPEGTKAKTMRDAITLYRNQNQTRTHE